MKRKIFSKLLVISVLLAGFAALYTPDEAFAAVGGGGAGGTATGGGGTGNSIGKKVGGGWYYFWWGESGSQAPSLAPSNYYPNNPVTWNNGGIEYVGESGFPGGTIGAECASVGGYYVSSWYHFLRGTTYVGLVGVAQNSIWNDYATLYDSTKGGTSYGAGAGYTVPIGRPVDMTIVKDAFNTAVGAGVVPSNVTWENVGWFCYHDDLKEKKGEVHAKSTITATTDGATYSEESDEDGFVGIKISTDSGTVDVSFGQTFTFKPGKDANGNDYDFTTDNPSKTFSEAYTYIGTKKNGESAINASRTWDATANSNSLTWSPTEDKNTITVNLDEGEVTQPICRSAKNYNTELNFKGTSEPEGSNPASTEACIVIERPKKPGPEEENLSPSITGRNSTDPMYIGEGSSIGWNTKVYNKVKKLKYNDNGNLTVKTRRLKRYKVISYLVNPNLQRTVNNTTESVAGNSSYSSNNLCDYIRSVLGASNVSGCGVVKGRDNDASKDRDETWDEATTDEYPYRKEQAVVVPENYGSDSSIGAKYCTTMGYKFQYWYGVNRTGGSSWTSHITWQEDPKRDSYWYIFPSACSVIAKRPSMAVWNGSVFADAGVKTSLSQRYANTAMGTLISQTSLNRAYGSWGEYLLIGNGEINGMASASALVKGITTDMANKNLNVAVDSSGNSNSRMTIQNLIGDKLGQADIDVSNSYGPNLVGLATETYDSSWTIREDIKTSGSFNVREIPQRVIYVKGDLNIESEVTRIDAWLIVDGTINTCSDVPDGQLDSTKCTKQLQFNGPVLAKSLNLRRTIGAEKGDAAESAEVFNFRPDAYIWAYNQSVEPDDETGYDYQIVNSKELAPRY